jgi:hypothetical protein
MSDMGDESTTVDTAAVMAALTGDDYDAPTDDSYEEYDDSQEVDPGEDDTDQYEDDDAAPDDDLGPDPDLSDLDPAQRAFLEKRIVDLRRLTTEKTTRAAEAMRVLDAAGGNAQDVQDAYEFAQALQNDPAVRAQLFAALQAEQAQSGSQPEPDASSDDDLSDYDLPPEIRARLSKVDELQSRFDALDAREAERVEQENRAAYVQEVYDDLAGQWQDISEAYPDLQGQNAQEAKEIQEDIMSLGADTNGDLGLALDKFRRIEARAQNRLKTGAARVSGGSTTPPRGAGHSTEPPEPITDFKEAGAAAFEYLEALRQNG